MKKLLFSLMTLVSLTCGAQKVSINDARSRAAEFLSHSGKMKKVAAKGIKSTDLTLAESNSERIYVFNVGNDEGFVVVSGDSRTRSILGYGDGCGFNIESAPDNMKALLKGYEAEIASLEGKEIAAQSASEPDAEPYGKAIEPLLKSKWNQREPYNILCPEVAGQRSVTGCVCTALAQVLYYWKAPKQWVANQPGYQSVQSGYSFYMPELPATQFKWDDMCDTYEKEDNRTAKQDTAVAELMSYCGQALKMGYTPNGSGTPEINTVNALKEFGFSEKTMCVRRSQYSIKEWESMVYDHLKRGIPVPYTGTTDETGHSFVCDGYAGNGMFHINWGWGGRYDSYFLLSILNPYNNDEAGASSASMGYNIEQMMVINAEPVDYPVGEVPYLTAGYNYEMQKMNETGDMIKIGTQNASGRNGVFEMALATKGADGSLTPVVYCYDQKGQTAQSVPINNVGEFICSISSARLQDGTYDLYPVYRCVSIVGDTWKPLLREKYIRAVVSNSSVTATPMPALALTIEKVENKGNGYALESQHFEMTIRNNGEIDHTSLLGIQVIYEGDEQGAYTQNTMVAGFIPVGASVPVEFFITPNHHGNATAYVYSGQDGGSPFAMFPITFREQRKEFVEALKATQFSVAYNYDANKGLDVGLALELTNTFSESVTRDIVVIVQNKGTNMMQSLGRMAFKINGHGPLQQIINFSPSVIAAYNFNTDLSDGLDFYLASPLGKNYQPFFSIHIPYGYIATPNGYVTDIRDVYESDNDNEKAYSLTGIPVGDDYRGIVIKNGKKILKK